MKFLLFTPILAMALASCSSSGISISKIAYQESIAKGVLSGRVQTKIVDAENVTRGGCQKQRVHRVFLQSSARGKSGTIISAREDWVVDSCGRNVIYQVDYYGPLGENTNIHVKLIRR